MAMIDKLYLNTRKEALNYYLWAEMFDDFCFKATNKSLLDCFYYRHYNMPNIYNVLCTNTSLNVDEWVWMHCPLKPVRDYMQNMWGYTDRNRRTWKLYIDRNFDREKFRLNRTLSALNTELQYKYNSTKAIENLQTAYQGILHGDSQYKYITQLESIWLDSTIY